jgi:hypothetical protein
LRQHVPLKATAILYGQIMGLKVASCQLKVIFGEIAGAANKQQRKGPFQTMPKRRDKARLTLRAV